MAGKIPSTFIDDLIARVDIVDVIDRRVPLTRKGKEFMACCPFHDEKTASFTVSPVKQFYHCFGCGAHGTAIGFLMDYANLGFVEAVEELADGLGMPIPQQSATAAAPVPGEGAQDLLEVVDQANKWFQGQLRNHPDAKNAVAYLKQRGLDGRIASEFGIGLAPDSWSGLADALGKTTLAQKQLVKVGLINEKDKVTNAATLAGKTNNRFYDRFRSRIIFPIEDHRGRVVAFGGRILGDGEPKYLNSPETSLFHKGAELYGLHKARRAVGAAGKSVVVEGYMDVVGLAQFGVDIAVATLGTATTRTHLQRLFRLAPEIVFCFDGDRAGRDAAWKGMQVVLPELQDGRQVGFMFLAEGEDPDTTVRSEGQEAFMARVENAIPLPDFLFDSLISQVDMSRIDGKARLVSLVKPLLAQMPSGALKDMMYSKLSSLSGLTDNQLGELAQLTGSYSKASRRKHKPDTPGQISPLASAISLLLQNPQFALTIDEALAIDKLHLQGADILIKLIDLIRKNETQTQTTAQLLESLRDSPHHAYLEKLAMRQHFIDERTFERLGDIDELKNRFDDTLTSLLKQQRKGEREEFLEKLRVKSVEPGAKGLSEAEKSKWAELMRDHSEN